MHQNATWLLRGACDLMVDMFMATSSRQVVAARKVCCLSEINCVSNSQRQCVNTQNFGRAADGNWEWIIQTRFAGWSLYILDDFLVGGVQPNFNLSDFSYSELITSYGDHNSRPWQSYSPNQQPEFIYFHLLLISTNNVRIPDTANGATTHFYTGCRENIYIFYHLKVKRHTVCA